MFSLFASQERKMRANAANWLELADKVWHFRRDQLRETEAADLRRRTGELQQQVKARADAGKLKLAIENLELVLRRTGGAIYPKSSLVENVEFFLVAAIVILGIRTYFVQPFKIPTNSMWPTYHGMTAENLPPGTEAPGLLGQAFRLVAFGAQRRTAVASADGEVSVDIFNNGQIAYTEEPGRTWLILPTTVRQYTFYVDDVPTHVTVPLDFSRTTTDYNSEFDRVVIETYFGTPAAYRDYLKQLRDSGRFGAPSVTRIAPGELAQTTRIPLGRRAKTGDVLVRFDLLTGDQLFVDRLSYNFVRPQVGQGFVFRTDNIHSPYMTDRSSGKQIEQYYIKRLVGVPGDVLEVREPVLWRNGQPISGAAAFEKNAKREGDYHGYFNGDYLPRGRQLRVPEDGFFAMGDNSANSQDGRYWGFVPRKDAVGRPLFIYYPFTRRWGPAH